MLIEFEDYKNKLNALLPKLEALGESLQLDDARNEVEKLEEESAQEGFWNDTENSQKVQKRISALKNKIEKYEKLRSGWDDMMTICEMAMEEDDDSMLEELQSEYAAFEEKLETMRLQTLLTGEYDANNAILTFHAGAGGTEAQDWTQMLYRMYTRFGERMGFTVRELDMLDGDEAGVKSVTWEVSGDYAYGFMKSERGVHRLVRISPFDANARRHTSFASLDVAPVIEDEGEIPIDPDDLRIDTYRASGKGGQHVNRTDSAVRITHLPTGIVVQCQNERSQVQNKETCFKMLRARLAELQEQKRQELMGEVKGELKKIEWGSQIRSYVFQPYTLVKDHRTGYEMGNIDDVMDGDLEGFVTAYLQKL